MALGPDGVLVSNGPDDPDPVTYGIETVRRLLGRTPLFGICLGQQLITLAVDAKSDKLKNGPRGANHPVMDLSTRRIEITSQHHGFESTWTRLPKMQRKAPTSISTTRPWQDFASRAFRRYVGSIIPRPLQGRKMQPIYLSVLSA